MADYYSRVGRPMTQDEWAAKFEEPGYKMIEKTDVEGTNSHVSTVWLGLDHRFDDGPPLIFETLVFDGRMGDTMERHSTEEEARAGHSEMVAKVRLEQEMFEMTLHHTRRTMQKLGHVVGPHAQRFGLDPAGVLTALYQEVAGDD